MSKHLLWKRPIACECSFLGNLHLLPPESAKPPKNSPQLLACATSAVICIRESAEPGGSELGYSWERQLYQCQGRVALLPASEPGLRLLEVVPEEQIQGGHAVLQSQRQVWPGAPAEPKQTQSLDERRKRGAENTPNKSGSGTTTLNVFVLDMWSKRQFIQTFPKTCFK